MDNTSQTHQRRLPKPGLAALCIAMLMTTGHAYASSEAFEREQLMLIQKQLHNAELLLKNAQKNITPNETTRFWFDYQRLEKDLQQIQLGVQNYLSPHRAQPRDSYDIARSYSRSVRELNTSMSAANGSH